VVETTAQAAAWDRVRGPSVPETAAAAAVLQAAEPAPAVEVLAEPEEPED